MAKLNRDAIVAQLAAQGLRHRSVTVQTEGEYLAADADWNNKDVPHLNELHSWADDVTCVIERNFQASVSLQKVLGLTFPLVLVHYDSDPDHQTHFLTVLAWTMVTDIEFVSVTPTRTRVVTTYTILGTRFWMLFFPIIRALLRRNYRRLMSEDVPLRERRGLLRSWGYTFRGDGTSPRDIRSSLAIGADNVVAPDEVTSPTLPAIDVRTIGEAGWTFVGRTDHLGLKLKREGPRVLAYARMCPHEGADLDRTPAADGCQTCPWHGRRLPPLAVLDLDGPGARAETPWHVLSVDGEQLHITLRDQDAGAPSSTRLSPSATTGPSEP